MSAERNPLPKCLSHLAQLNTWRPIETAAGTIKGETFLVSNGLDVRTAFFLGGELYVATGYHKASDLKRSWLGEPPELPPDRWMPLP